MTTINEQGRSKPRHIGPPLLVRRAVALVLDLWLLGALTLFVPSAVEIVVLQDILGSSKEAAFDAGRGAINTFAAVGWPLYFIVLWSVGRGQTLGMIWCGARVVRSNGAPLSLPRSCLRLVGVVLSVIPIFAGIAWILIDTRRRGWHDLIADTVVVGIRPRWA